MRSAFHINAAWYSCKLEIQKVSQAKIRYINTQYWDLRRIGMPDYTHFVSEPRINCKYYGTN